MRAKQSPAAWPDPVPPPLGAGRWAQTPWMCSFGPSSHPGGCSYDIRSKMLAEKIVFLTCFKCSITTVIIWPVFYSSRWLTNGEKVKAKGEDAFPGPPSTVEGGGVMIGRRTVPPHR